MTEEFTFAPTPARSAAESSTVEITAPATGSSGTTRTVPAGGWYPGNRPGSGGGIPGFTSRTWAARFHYPYRKPQPSGRP
ncbi:hypothetical protein [Streptomyces sp. NPDC057301]|uniref:hypothetical protein n=1 Tax=Streptomyces sp. NPDC057301 TaxID=3346093 RepID=UPI00363CE2FA